MKMIGKELDEKTAFELAELFDKEKARWGSVESESADVTIVYRINDDNALDTIQIIPDSEDSPWAIAHRLEAIAAARAFARELDKGAFKLHPAGGDAHALASRVGLLAYASHIEPSNPRLAAEIRDWVVAEEDACCDAAGGSDADQR